MAQLQLHPTWAENLNKEQKEAFARAADKISVHPHEWHTELFRAKHKKNSGIVATVLLCNGNDRTLTLNKLKAEIINHENKIVAAEVFSVQIEIKAGCAYPWSFVFSDEAVQKADSEPAQWRVNVSSLTL